ncbi:MAG: DUF551 domain-containing protein [Paludibacteraceae bacterium]|nr:DUF551 domain-containing protein [Paludibacteraceae bacterium]
MKEQIEKQAIEEMVKISRHVCEGECFINKDGLIDCDVCISLHFYDNGYRKQSEWISVDERLPDVRRKVMLYSPTDGINIGHRLDEVGRFYVGKAYPDRPTHWMPLPEPPKGE